jgi:hypothetical protein
MEGRYRHYRVSEDRSAVEFGMVQCHLGRVGLWPLRLAIREIGAQVVEQLELHNRATARSVSLPPPSPLFVRFEVGTTQSSFQTGRVDRATRDLKIDLYIDVGRAP